MIPASETAFLWGALAAYVVAGSIALASLGQAQSSAPRVLAFLASALALHTVAIALRWDRVGHGPFITLFEALSSNVWSLGLVFTLAYWRVRAVRETAAVVMPILFVLMAWLVASDPYTSYLPATYRTIWLWVHVALGKIFLGLVLVGVGISGIILMRRAGIAGSRLGRLPADERLENLAFRFVVVGFLFESLMLVAGAIWAQDAWGRFWAWDPLETWSFVTWMALAATIHARISFRLAPPVSAVLVIGVFLIAFLTFFGIPFVSTSVHKGAV